MRSFSVAVRPRKTNAQPERPSRTPEHHEHGQRNGRRLRGGEGAGIVQLHADTGW